MYLMLEVINDSDEGDKKIKKMGVKKMGVKNIEIGSHCLDTVLGTMGMEDIRQRK